MSKDKTKDDKLTGELTPEQLQTLEKFRQEQDDENTASYMFYALLKDSHPGFVNLMEHRAAVLLHAGNVLGQEIVHADLDPKRKAELYQQFQQIAVKINSAGFHPEKKEEEEEL